MRRFASVLATAVALSGGAYAADIGVAPMAVAPPPPPPPSWSGLYVGAHVGYGDMDNRIYNKNNNASINPPELAEDIQNPLVEPDNEGLLFILDRCQDNGDASCLDFNPNLVEDEDDDDEYDFGGGPFADADGRVDGVFGGLQIGYDFQVNSFLFGIVADASVSGMQGDVEFFQDDEDASDISNIPTGIGTADLDYEPAPIANFDVDNNWLATLRLRAGWLATQNWLIYAHGGLAVADFSIMGVGGNGPYAPVNHDETTTGWILGLGTEVKVGSGLSIFVEGSYIDFSSVDIDQNLSERADLEMEIDDVWLAKVGFNWRPDWMFGS